MKRTFRSVIEVSPARSVTEGVVPCEFAAPMRAVAEFALGIDMLRYNHARGLGVSIPDMLAMSFILQAGSVTPKAIAARLQMTTGSVTALLDRLEERGIIERRANLNDRRSTLVVLTASGAEAILGDWKDFERRLASVAQSRKPTELEAITHFMNELAAALRT